jgi:hypothetical protein
MRGTLHFVAAPDVRWLLALVAPRIIARNTRRYSELELDERTLARSNAVQADTLRGGERLDRRSLLAILEENGISTRGQRAAYMLQRASLDDLICQSAVRRSNSTYMTLDEALPEAGTMEHGEAVAELARRYFTSRGPATLQDFVWWSGLVDSGRQSRPRGDQTSASPGDSWGPDLLVVSLDSARRFINGLSAARFR